MRVFLNMFFFIYFLFYPLRNSGLYVSCMFKRLFFTFPSQILDNWKYHKSKVASYWLVKLDSTKQRKVSPMLESDREISGSQFMRPASPEAVCSSVAINFLAENLSKTLWLNRSLEEAGSKVSASHSIVTLTENERHFSKQEKNREK